jgi:kynurenine formamidase
MTASDTTEQVGNWQRWGADDERGALNLITPDAVLGAARALSRGKVYQLGLPIQREGMPWFDYRGAPQRLTLTSASDSQMFEPFGAPEGLGANEDVLVLASHSITHMDALCHVFSDGKIYNGHPSTEFASHTGAPHCGIEKTAGFAARAVLLDLPGHQGVDWLEPGTAITADDLEACRQAQGTELRAGDVLLVRTGWLDQFFAGGGQGAGNTAQPGLGLSAARYVVEHEIAAVGADNSAVEVIPFDENQFLTVHIELLVKHGVTLLEHLRLSELAADGFTEGLFAVGALPVTGATGSPVNPIVIA